MCRSFKLALAVTPQGVPPKAGLLMQNIVSFRLGGSESAYLCNGLGKIIHIGYKKLEGPLQKVALVSTVNTSEH